MMIHSGAKPEARITSELIARAILAKCPKRGSNQPSHLQIGPNLLQLPMRVLLPICLILSLILHTKLAIGAHLGTIGSDAVASTTTGSSRSLQSDLEWQRVKDQLAISLNETLRLGTGNGGGGELISASQTPPSLSANRQAGIDFRNDEKLATVGKQQVSIATDFSAWARSQLQRLSIINNDNNNNDREPNTNNVPKYLVANNEQLNNLKRIKKDSANLQPSPLSSSNLVVVDDNVTDSIASPSPSSVLDDTLTGVSSELEERQQQGLPSGQPVDLTGGGDGGDAVSCSPDYEDGGPILIDSTSMGGSANLTSEQQAQLLNGSSESLGLQNSSGSMAQIFNGSNQCMSAGSRMIEVITKIITPILFSIIIVVGLLGNIIVMLVILEDRKTERELTPTNLLILDLSLADLSFIIFCIPFTGWDYAIGHWVFGQVWCKFNQYLIVVCALSSIYTLVLMSIDRFMAIVYPIECINYRTSTNMLNAIIIKWVLIFFIALPTIAMHGLIESPLGPEQFTCRFLSDQYNPLHFQIVFFVTSYLSPLVLIFCLYLSLLNKLWFGTKPHGHKESFKMLESKKKVTWLVASIVIVFALCWCPIQIMLILMRLKTHKITATYVAIQVFAHILGYMNSCINPIVYAFASETFNQSFKRSWFGRTFWRLFRTCCCGCCASCCAPPTNSLPPSTNLQSQFGPTGLGSRSMSLANAHHQNYNTTSSSLPHHQHQQAPRLSGTNLLLKATTSTSPTNEPRNRSLNHIFATTPGSQTSTTSNADIYSPEHKQNKAQVNNELTGEQIQLGTLTGNQQQISGEGGTGGGNQSERVFIGQVACKSTQAKSNQYPLVLEPRDRPYLPPAPAPQMGEPKAVVSSSRVHETSCDHSVSSPSASSPTNSLGSQTSPSSSASSHCEFAQTMGATETSICSQTTCHNKSATNSSTTSIGPHQAHQKQHLVARMIQAPNGSKQQAIAHECEPCTNVDEHELVG